MWDFEILLVACLCFLFYKVGKLAGYEEWEDEEYRKKRQK